MRGRSVASSPIPMMFITEPKPTEGFHWTQTPWGRALVCDELARHAAHLFTAGDLELRSDDREWAAVAQLLDVPRARIRLISQFHGADIAVVCRGDSAEYTPGRADGIVTDDCSVAIGVRVADCAPVLIADTTQPAVAAIHAGWRGTMQGVVGEGVRTLSEEFGSHPANLIAAIGPCLGPCCGEMGPEVPMMFREAGHADATVERWFTAGPSGRPYFDLWQANRDQLEAAGVDRARIFAAGLCTRSHPDVFHSYRAKGPEAGRMLGIIRARG